MTKQINILSTKTLTPIQRQVFIDANLDLLEQDFIEVQNTNYNLDTIHQNIIFTSQNAILSVVSQPNLEILKNKNVFCVGLHSKELLEQNGFEVAVYLDYASELAEIITLIYNTESFTFFSGNLRKDTLPNALKENEIKFNEVQTYKTNLTPFKISKHENFDAILFFSPSAVESYFKDNKIQNEICFCIGNTTAKALNDKKIKNIIIAESPSIENVIFEAVEYYKNINLAL